MRSSGSGRGGSRYRSGGRCGRSRRRRGSLNRSGRPSTVDPPLFLRGASGVDVGRVSRTLRANRSSRRSGRGPSSRCGGGRHCRRNRGGRGSGGATSAFDSLVALHFIAGVVVLAIGAGASRTQADLDLQRTVMQLGAVLHLDDADGVADGRQRLVADLDGHRVLVLQVDTIEDLAVRVFLRGQDGEFGFEVGAGTVGRRLHFRGRHVTGVPTRWDGLRCGCGGDLRCVKVQVCH